MIEKVSKSTFVWIYTVLGIAFFAILSLCDLEIHNGLQYTLRYIFAIFCIVAVCYSPTAITVGNGELRVIRMIFFLRRRIRLSEISDIELFQTTVADRNIFGNFGFLGYFGWFNNPEIGRYFAYVGRWKDTFLVELKSGRKYILSCDNPQKIVEAVKQEIQAAG